MYTPLLTHACTAASAAGGGIFSGELAQRRDVSPAYRLRIACVSSRLVVCLRPSLGLRNTAWRGVAWQDQGMSAAPRHAHASEPGAASTPKHVAQKRLMKA